MLLFVNGRKRRHVHFPFRGADGRVFIVRRRRTRFGAPRFRRGAALHGFFQSTYTLQQGRWNNRLFIFQRRDALFPLGGIHFPAAAAKRQQSKFRRHAHGAGKSRFPQTVRRARGERGQAAGR